jgi:hypothetical protein
MSVVALRCLAKTAALPNLNLTAATEQTESVLQLGKLIN